MCICAYTEEKTFLINYSTVVCCICCYWLLQQASIKEIYRKEFVWNLENTAKNAFCNSIKKTFYSTCVLVLMHEPLLYIFIFYVDLKSILGWILIFMWNRKFTDREMTQNAEDMKMKLNCDTCKENHVTDTKEQELNVVFNCN